MTPRRFESDAATSPNLRFEKGVPMVARYTRRETHLMSINSKEIDPASPSARSTVPLQPGGLSGFSIGAVGMLISAIIWLIGARWTVDGLVVMFNAVLHFFNTNYQAPIPPHVLVYVCLSPIPLAFSAVEWHVPIRREKSVWHFAPLGDWAVWTTVLFFDWYTSYLGLGVDPGPDAMTFMRQLSASIIPRVLVSAILTAGPEWLAREMWARLYYVFTGKRK